MKHIKLFEKQGDIFWIVIYEDIDNLTNNWQILFDNEESAKNYYIEAVSEIAHNRAYKNSNIITSLEEANNWLKENSDMFRMYYKQITNIGKYDLPEKLKIIHDTKKYNL